ncbi:putative bifunctional diguanylate cyclase/phosphodiesterase [Salinisphaera sp.]|uniref:putative bifunctional diguanylate cyclase/phosphodiesterase n=1 Tax=Salinisphaera sp. TaxID=1914330 RepID=UPI002D78401D|nr:EAL domain-containing protein [Salinisphaera sp.]HET7313203.1 EAL domain-containing protein [Salinisphaera sp.]
MVTESELQRLRQRAERERAARLEAEAIAEKATLELYNRNTKLEAAYQRLEASEATLYRELFDHNPLPMFVVARDSLQFLEINATARQCYGFERSEFLTMTLRDIEPVAELEDADARRKGWGPDQRGAGLWHHVTHDGQSIEVELSVHILQWRDQPAWLLVVRDVTEQRHDRRTLELRNQAIESSHNGMFICSAQAADYPIVYLNAAMEHFSGNTRDELLEQPLSHLFTAEGARDAARMISTLEAGRNAQALIAAQAGDGQSLWLEVQMTPVMEPAGTMQNWIGIVKDVTEHKALEETLVHRAHHDALTGLPNHDSLRRQLQGAIAAARDTGDEVAVMYLDLDDFKQINDIGGHDIGDHYLKTLAARLRNRVRDADTLARVGGDEFVLVTVGADLTETLSDLARRLQSAFKEPVVVAGQAFTAQCSIGIALYPDHGDDAETLLKRADLTMYMAKRNGGHDIAWFNADMEAGFRQKAEIQIALQKALVDDEFEVHYQPQVDMRHNTVVGLEALLRWPTAAKAYRSPADFIPVAEASGLIRPIGAWALARACADLAMLRHNGHEALTMAVNVSAVQLRERDFAAQVAALLDRHRLPPAALEIEMTESVLMAEHDKAESTLCILETMGVRLAIDDFGTGYSSLSYIRRIPVHRLKIDRSFIQGMGQSARAGELVKNVARMAHNLDLEPLAEGVETEAEMQTLLGYDCFLAQGYHFSRALPLDQITRLLDMPPSPIASSG